MPPFRVLFVLLPSLCSCDLVLGAPEYHVGGEEELIERYSTGTAGCHACLGTGACGVSFEACVALPGCAAFAECLVREPSPASEASCVAQLSPEKEVRSAARALGDCFRSCYQACDAGGDFSCANDFAWPPAPGPTIELTQTLTLLDAPPAEGAVAGARVSICPEGIDCATPLQPGGEPLLTDQTGRYRVEIEIATRPASIAGFWGFRLVEGERIRPHRLEKNVPILVDHEESTGLLSSQATQLLSSAYGIAPTLDAIVFQVFDCREVGARGVRVSAPDSPGASVFYLEGEPSSPARRDTGTFASAEGAGAIVGLAVGQTHRIEVTLGDAQPLITTQVYVPGDAVVMLSLYPSPRAY